MAEEEKPQTTEEKPKEPSAWEKFVNFFLHGGSLGSVGSLPPSPRGRGRFCRSHRVANQRRMVKRSRAINQAQARQRAKPSVAFRQAKGKASGAYNHR